MFGCPLQGFLLDINRCPPAVVSGKVSAAEYMVDLSPQFSLNSLRVLLKLCEMMDLILHSFLIGIQGVSCLSFQPSRHAGDYIAASPKAWSTKECGFSLTGRSPSFSETLKKRGLECEITML